MKLLFIEATRFTERIQQLRAESQLWALQDVLCQDPEKGDVIQGTGGFKRSAWDCRGVASVGDAGSFTCT